MARGKAEDADRLMPAKDDNAALYHFDPRTLPIFKCVNYIAGAQHKMSLSCSSTHRNFIVSTKTFVVAQRLQTVSF